MPKNPDRMSQGGDVEGWSKTDDTQGTSISVAKASFDPGYDLDSTLQDANPADLIKGYCTGRYAGNGAPSRNDEKYGLPSRKAKV